MTRDEAIKKQRKLIGRVQDAAAAGTRAEYEAAKKTLNKFTDEVWSQFSRAIANGH